MVAVTLLVSVCVVPLASDTAVAGEDETISDGQGLVSILFPAGDTDTYRFTGQAGQRVSVSMASSSVDSYLHLYRPDGSLAAETGVGGTGMNARISQLLLDQSGTWRFEASSTGGAPQGIYRVDLYLETGVEPPSEPGSLSAVGGDRTVTLSWTSPVTNGGAPITGFRIYRDGGLVLSPSGSATQAVDGGLVNGQQYEYTISAVNLAGEGERTSGSRVTPLDSTLDALVSRTNNGVVAHLSLLAPAYGTIQSSPGSGVRSSTGAPGRPLCINWSNPFAPCVRSIIGTDDRVTLGDTTAFPRRAVVSIRSFGGLCSGWMISADTAVTAAHCLFDGSRWATDVRVTPGQNGRTAPFGTCSASRLWITRGWMTSLDPTRDYGAIDLDCRVGLRTGWLGFSTTGGALQQRPIAAYGYAFDRRDASGIDGRVVLYPLMVRSRGKVQTASISEIYYNNDSAAGQSGSALIADEICQSCAIGVLAYGRSGSSGLRSQWNYGPRITPAAFVNLRYLRQH